MQSRGARLANGASRTMRGARGKCRPGHWLAPRAAGIFGPMADRPLWHCKKCGRDFANRNQSHSCATHDLDHHFRGKGPAIRALYDRVVSEIRAIGPVRVLPEKTRIAFQVRMSFAQITPRQGWLDGHVVLARRLESPRFRSIQTISARNHVHVFRLREAGEIDDEFRAFLAEAYRVGAQEHLAERRRR
jgi:hypothetical protein